MRLENLSPVERQVVVACRLAVVNFLQDALLRSEFSSLAVRPEWSLSESADEGQCLVVTSNADFDIPGSLKLVCLLEEHMASVIADVHVSVCRLCVNLVFRVRNDVSRTTDDKSSDSRLADVKPIRPLYTMSQVVLPYATRQRIMADIQVVANHDLVYNKWGFAHVDPHPHSIINLYGPPGTGKTMLAHAIADSLGRPFLCFNYADIESKWVGEAAKNLRSAFSMAREQNAVMFFDEADSFLSKRIVNGSNGHEQSINSQRSQMLIYLEEHVGLVIFATNLEANYDEAFRSRILDDIRIDLPDTDARAAIIRGMLPPELPWDHLLSDDELMPIAKSCEGFSGRDIKKTVMSMLFRKAAITGNDSIFTTDDISRAFADAVEQRRQNSSNVKLRTRIAEAVASTSCRS